MVFCILIALNLVITIFFRHGATDNNTTTATNSAANSPKSGLETNSSATDLELGIKHRNLGLQKAVDKMGSRVVRMGPTEDFVKARMYFEKACNQNNGAACFELGDLYYEAMGVRYDYNAIKTNFEKACNLQYGKGCSRLGGLHYDGMGVKRNLSTAKNMFGKGCDLGDKDGCMGYKILNEKGIK